MKNTKQCLYFLVLGLTALCAIAAAALISKESSTTNSSDLTSNRVSLPQSVKASVASSRWGPKYTNCAGRLSIKAERKGRKYRPCGVVARIHPNCVQTGQEARGNIYGMDDFIKTFPLYTGGEYPYARCHIIPRQLLGSAAPENLFPCYQRPFNAVTMFKYETDVINWLNDNPQGYIVYEVYTEYGNPNQPWPTSLLMRARNFTTGPPDDLFSVRIANSPQATVTAAAAAEFYTPGFYTDPNCI